MVCVKTPHDGCSKQFKKGMVTRVYSPHSILVNVVLRHIRDRDLLCQKMPAVIGCVRATHVLLFLSAGPDDSLVKMTMMVPTKREAK